MASNNRSTQINKVLKVVKKHFAPVLLQGDRSVLEHLVYACCVENSLCEQAEKVFQSLANDYYDWNEVRVSTIRELSELMKPLNDPEQAALRLKRVLQSMFETLYSFDLEPMKKQNIGQSIKQLDKIHGTTPFTVAYVTQHGLGGHSIPINQGLLQVMWVVGVISDAEAKKKAVPGLERAVPKSKGVEVGSLLHQLGVELYRSPYGPAIRKLLLEIDASCKQRLPKRPTKKDAQPKPGVPATAATQQPAARSATGSKKKAPAKKSATPSKKKAASKTSSRPKKKTRPTAKKTPKKKVKTATRTKKKTTNKKLKKKKPR